jgi:ParB family chromosome partitioning protein
LPKSDSRLGKGLGALLGDVLEVPTGTEVPVEDVEVVQIEPNRFQPRSDFDPSAIAQLRASIKQNGLIQPLVVRRAPGGFELVAGERRLRAVRDLGWERVPAVIRELSDEAMLVLALVENLQRENLNPVEEAVAFQQLIDGFGFTQREVAKRVGRDRSTISNTLRLLTLPASIRDMLVTGELTAGHGRAVLILDDEPGQLALAREIAKHGLSVRDAERRAKRTAESGTKRSAARARDAEDPVVRRASTLLARSFGTGVEIRLKGKQKGEIRIPFHDAEDFERLLRRLLDAEATELFDSDA